MTAQINGLNQLQGTQQTRLHCRRLQKVLSEVTNNLQRIRELAVQSVNATANSGIDRTALQAEVTELMAEINRVSNQTKFNGVNLLNGSFSAQSFQVGANASETVTISSIASSRTADLGTFNGIQATGVVFGVVNDVKGLLRQSQLMALRLSCLYRG